MNGTQIEALLNLIDGNVQLTGHEVATYILEHQDVIAKSLVETGNATIETSTGPICLSLKDLEAVAA